MNGPRADTISYFFREGNIESYISDIRKQGTNTTYGLKGQKKCTGARLIQIQKNLVFELCLFFNRTKPVPEHNMIMSLTLIRKEKRIHILYILGLQMQRDSSKRRRKETLPQPS